MKLIDTSDIKVVVLLKSLVAAALEKQPGAGEVIFSIGYDEDQELRLHFDIPASERWPHGRRCTASLSTDWPAGTPRTYVCVYSDKFSSHYYHADGSELEQQLQPAAESIVRVISDTVRTS
jgi:hypothetical protein